MIHALSDFLICIFLLGRILPVKCLGWDRKSRRMSLQSCNCKICGLGRTTVNLRFFKIQIFFSQVKARWVPASLHFHNYCPHTWQPSPKFLLLPRLPRKHWSTRKLVRFGAGERKWAARKRCTGQRQNNGQLPTVPAQGLSQPNQRGSCLPCSGTGWSKTAIKVLWINDTSEQSFT